MKPLCQFTQTKLGEDENGVVWIWCDVCRSWERIYNFTWHMRHVHTAAWRSLRDIAREMR